jgi:ribosomal protein L40E
MSFNSRSDQAVIHGSQSTNCDTATLVAIYPRVHAKLQSARGQCRRMKRALRRVEYNRNSIENRRLRRDAWGRLVYSPGRTGGETALCACVRSARKTHRNGFAVDRSNRRMSSPSTPHWTFAARAAYFGDRMCGFCDHRNPAGAKFCNECASPLDLRPCKQCDAVNDQAATNCYRCGAACPAMITAPMATPAWPAADSTRASATPDDLPVAATTQPLFAATALPAGFRLPGRGHFLVAAIATVLVVGAYHAYRINGESQDAMGAVLQPYDAPADNAATATAAVPAPMATPPEQAERSAAFEAPIPASSVDAPKRATVRQRSARVPAAKRAAPQQRPVPVPAIKRASAHQRTLPEHHARIGTAPPVARAPAVARVGARVPQTSKTSRMVPWQLMRVSLARCGGDFIARIVCDQRVRRHFCEGHWGTVPGCVSGVVNDHGQ